jgi:hypothetical protein
MNVRSSNYCKWIMQSTIDSKIEIVIPIIQKFYKMKVS